MLDPKEEVVPLAGPVRVHRPMRICVTGGAGFLGHHLVRRLVADGHTVVVMDDFSTGRAANLEPGDRLGILKCDVREPLPDVPCERVYHLACPASPVEYQRDPVRTLVTAVMGTKHALDLALRRGARLLLASTSEVYGDPAVHPQPETYRGNVSTTGPRACYDEGKRAAEALACDYERAHGADVRIARIFNTYGPGMREDDGRVIPTFIAQALRGEPLTLHGDGSQTRCFCHVSDMVDGLVRLMESSVRGPVNLGSQIVASMYEIARDILALLGEGGSFVHVPRPEDDPQDRCPDLTRARTLLGWDATTTLAEGLRSMMPRGVAAC